MFFGKIIKNQIRETHFNRLNFLFWGLISFLISKILLTYILEFTLCTSYQICVGQWLMVDHIIGTSRCELTLKYPYRISSVIEITLVYHTHAYSSHLMQTTNVPASYSNWHWIETSSRCFCLLLNENMQLFTLLSISICIQWWSPLIVLFFLE